MSIPAHIEHVFKALDIIERKPVEFEYSRDGKLTHISPSPSPDGQHGRKSALSGAQHELSGEGRPTAGPGTAGAGLPIVRYWTVKFRHTASAIWNYTHVIACDPFKASLVVTNRARSIVEAVVVREIDRDEYEHLTRVSR